MVNNVTLSGKQPVKYPETLVKTAILPELPRIEAGTFQMSETNN